MEDDVNALWRQLDEGGPPVRYAGIATLTAEEAAHQMGITATQFLGAVERGELPPPALSCRPKRWSVAQIEWWLIHRAKDDKPAPPEAGEPKASETPPPKKQTSDPWLQAFATRVQDVDEG